MFVSFVSIALNVLLELVVYLSLELGTSRTGAFDRDLCDVAIFWSYSSCAGHADTLKPGVCWILRRNAAVRRWFARRAFCWLGMTYGREWLLARSVLARAGVDLCLLISVAGAGLHRRCLSARESEEVREAARCWAGKFCAG